MKYSQEALDLFNTNEVQERFWIKVNKTQDCWEWTASKSPKGYGKFRMNSMDYRSHILSLWSHLNECDNPSCVNPDHLWYGTAFDNMRDAYNKGRLDYALAQLNNGRPRKGESNGNSKITESQAIEILKVKKETGKGPKGLQEMFPNLTCRTIQELIYNQTWKHLPR